MKACILSIDQGTTGTRAFIFDARGRVVASAYQEFKQYYPNPGWVEHDADEIWASVVNVVRRAIRQSRMAPNRLAAIGITNQRETIVVWDRQTSRPLYRAIVWQCRRTAELCRQLKAKGWEADVRRRTGLVLVPYFAGTKVSWIKDNVPGLRQKASQGKIAIGTIDSWLIWKLTGGQAHATDMTNASRTLLFNIHSLNWDDRLIKRLKIPQSVLPVVQPSGSVFGKTASAIKGLPSGIPITGVMGDQQAALYGQGCFAPGEIKNTYGTGCFLLLNTGKKCIQSRGGLLTTIAADQKGKPVYALEGAVFIAGAVIQWLRDELKIIRQAAQTERLALSVPDTQGVYFVPAFVGLGAPYWNASARGVISGLTRGTNAAHIVRAALESIAFQTKEVFDLMQKESGKKIRELKVDGGAVHNNFLMQFQADILNCGVARPAMIESTARGAALLAGVTIGLWSSKHRLRNLLAKERVFKPMMSSRRRVALMAGWEKAIRQTLAS